VKALQNPHEALSEREFQIMLMLARGKSVTEIAKDIFISDKTVSTYRARIMEKMGLKKNADLTLYAIKNNLIE
jgi:two-component system invasion response regulator UvrY